MWATLQQMPAEPEQLFGGDSSILLQEVLKQLVTIGGQKCSPGETARP